MSTQDLQMEVGHPFFEMVYDKICSYEWIPKDTCYNVIGVCEDYAH